MKEQYMRQVKKELHLSRKEKMEILRDLNEIFASAVEHGETEQQVIERLGTPKDFADSTAEQFGIDNTASQKQKGRAETQFAQEQHTPERPEKRKASVQKLMHRCSFCSMTAHPDLSKKAQRL